MDNVKIGKLIGELRRNKGLTQQELGDMVGVGFRAISKWERGMTMPDISSLVELSKIFGIKTDYILSLSSYYRNVKSKTLKEKNKLSTFIEQKINQYKKENYTVLKDIGIAVVVEVIVLNILNELTIKNSIIILTIGFLCISISDKLKK